MKTARPSGLKLVERADNVEASLWRRLRFEEDQSCRETLFNRHYDMARKLARKQYYRRPHYGLELPDFEQFAFAGLLEAIDGYNPLKNVPFEAYARYRINGSISNGLTTSSENGAQYGHRRRVEKERLKSLSTTEKDQNKDEDDAIARLSDLAVGLALGLILEGAGFSHNQKRIDPLPNAYETLSWKELKDNLNNEVNRLPGTEKTVIKQHYLKDVAFVQIAHLLNVTKGRVSQLHRSGIIRLRKKIRSFY